MDIFAKAVKQDLMFKTVRGLVTPQQLFKMPLTGNNDFNLDVVSREVLAEQNVQSDSLVAVTKANPLNELRIEILKFVIADIEAAEAAKLRAKKTRERKQQIASILARKENETLENLSEADLRKLLLEDEEE